MIAIADAQLSKNQFSRPGVPLDRVMAIVVHYLGNPGQGPRGARDYWEGLKTQDAADKNPDVSASAHYVVGFKGEVLLAIPEEEKAYHCGGASYTSTAQAFFGIYCSPQSSPNRVTIGVELCHADTTGRPSIVTRSAARELVRDLCQRHGLDPKRDLWRHWDITGPKANGVICPKWFVEHPDDWAAFIASI
jgi:N-acetylmuramoyl-L-alanine amidase